ncbi:MAG: UDP-GlcNAc:undecaprenyl-phosphate GlcNAc-1-phosphate transferase [Francisellaceae bacterium]|jgi:UDP-GlcNAc:undecaprenyl-phosphate GlcNAc-1-phosphate transferase
MASLLELLNNLELRIYLIASAMMVFIDAFNNKFDLNVCIRVIGQIIIASLMVYGVSGFISNLSNLFSFGGIELGPIGVIFCYYCSD